MKVTKETSYEIVISSKYDSNVIERNDLESAMEVYEKHKNDPLLKEMFIQKVERLVVKRLFNGKESNY